MDNEGSGQDALKRLKKRLSSNQRELARMSREIHNEISKMEGVPRELVRRVPHRVSRFVYNSVTGLYGLIPEEHRPSFSLPLSVVWPKVIDETVSFALVNFNLVKPRELRDREESYLSIIPELDVAKWYGDFESARQPDFEIVRAEAEGLKDGDIRFSGILPDWGARLVRGATHYAGTDYALYVGRGVSNFLTRAEFSLENTLETAEIEDKVTVLRGFD